MSAPTSPRPQGNLDPTELISLVQRRKALFAVLIGCATLVVSVIHFWLPIYEARTSLVFQSANSSFLQAVSAKLATFSAQEDEMRELERYVVRLSSPDFYRKVAEEIRKNGVDLEMFHKEMLSSKRRIAWNLGKLLHLPVPESTTKDLSDDEMAEIIDNYVSFSPSGTDRISVVVRSGDRRSSAYVVNVVADMAAKILLAEGLKDLEDAKSYLERQANESEKVIREIESNLAQIKVNRGIVGQDGGGGQAAQLAEIQKQLTDATLEADENRRRLAQLRSEVTLERRRDPSSSNARLDPDNRYGLPRRISQLERANSNLAIKQSALRKLVADILNGSQGDEQKIFELHKRMEFEYSIFEELKKEAFQLEMKSIGARNKVHVADHVRDNGAYRSDNLPAKLGIALILAVFGGLLISVVWELAWPSVRNGRDLVDAGFVYLGGIPLVAGRFAKERRSHGPRLCRFDSDSEVAMSFIQVRSRLLYLSDRKDARSTQTIAVVSAKIAEGKSFFCRNLAASFGYMGRRTLLIDCDLRRPASSEYFGMAEAPGLGEVLTGAKKFGEVVQRKVAKGVDVVPAGQVRSDVTHLFADGTLSQLLADLSEVYDNIILDTPSVIAVPDGPMISRAADLTLMVASMNQTTRNDLELSLERIRALRGGDVYAVLNRVAGGQVPLYVIHSGGKRVSASSAASGSLGGGSIS